mmetsp:Transcript_54853/g.161285  ORF Transcript_54853/g.161285 Transcript_54853/m.161285 type:complete len:205 (+) Transcript_54853:870-1484(+)
MNFLQRARVSGVIVALNIITCFFFGVSTKIVWMSLRMSSLSTHLSHSSSTNWLSLSSFRSFSRMSARMRPGVPMRTWGHASLSISLSFAMGMPPKTTPVFSSAKYLAKRSNSCLIWYASSRVWQMTRTFTAFSEASICCRQASTKTAVLPMPDFAWQRMSVPRMAWGMHSCCTSEGCSKPQSTMARRSSGFRRKSRKPEAWMEP